jgi:hypothetical protein
MPFDGNDLDDATKLLIEGRKRIEAGWSQYEFQNDRGAVCIEGAIRLPAYRDAVYRLQRAIGTRSLVSWNDAPGRTKEEVLAVFDRAIAELNPWQLIGEAIPPAEPLPVISPSARQHRIPARSGGASRGIFGRLSLNPLYWRLCNLL